MKDKQEIKEKEEKNLDLLFRKYQVDMAKIKAQEAKL